METIEHRGIIEQIDGKSMNVRIVQMSACSGCHAKSLCSSADKEEKIVNIPSFTGNFVVGQDVMVTGRTSSGFKAVFIAYVMPLILMVAGMALSLYWWFPGNEGISAIVALGMPVLYYLLLCLLGKILQKHFVFYVSHLSDDNLDIADN